LIIACNLLLILCAIASNYIGWPAIIPAVIVTGILLVWLARPSDGPVQTF
jgi:hypothetical protein